MFVTSLRAERDTREAWLTDKEGTAWTAKCCGCGISHNTKWQCRDCLVLCCKACTEGKQMLGIGRNACEECRAHSQAQASEDRPCARGEPWRQGPRSIQRSDAACVKRAKRRQEKFAKPWQAVWNYTPWHMACTHCHVMSGMKWHCTHCHKGFCRVCTMTKHQLGSSKDKCLQCRDKMKCGLLTHGTYLSPDMMRSLKSLSNGPPEQEEQPVPKRARVPEVTPEAQAQDSPGGNLEVMRSHSEATDPVDKQIMDKLEEGFTELGVMDCAIRRTPPNPPPLGNYGRAQVWKSHRAGGTPPSERSRSRCGSDDSRSSDQCQDQTGPVSPSTQFLRLGDTSWRNLVPVPGTIITNGRVAPSSAPYLMGTNGTLVRNYVIKPSSTATPSTHVPAQDV